VNLLISSSSPADKGSGINAYVNQIAAGFVGRGHKVHYLAPAPSSLDWLDAMGIRHVPHCNTADPLVSCKAIHRYILGNKIDGIINNDNAFLQSLAPIVPCTFVSVGHMSRTSVATLANHQHRWVDYIVTISQDMQRRFCNRFGAPLNRLPIVYNGVTDPGPVKSKAKMPDGRLHVVFSGGMDRNKGAYLLADSLRSRRELQDLVQISWFGEIAGGLKQTLAGLACVDLKGRVPRSEFLAVLSDADVLLLPSFAEGCPMVMLEAMSYGVIPIASNGAGAMQRLVISGQEGFICDLRDWAAEMAACLMQLHGNSSLLTRFSQAAYARFRSDFTVDNTLDQLEFLLRTPVVDRSCLPGEIDILRWHRPLLPGTNRAPLIDRFCIRAGILRGAGRMSITV